MRGFLFFLALSSVALAATDRPHFSPPATSATMTAKGLAMNTVTKKQLAELAGAVWHGQAEADVPEKLWIDGYDAGEQLYLRAIFSPAASVGSLALLVALARTIDETYGTELVCCMYIEDVDWSVIDERNRLLNLVR